MRNTTARNLALIVRQAAIMACIVIAASSGPSKAFAQKKNAKNRADKKQSEVTYPPVIPGGKQVVTDTAPDFLKPTETLRDGVSIAKTPPTVDFLYYPGQDWPGNPWSNWGDSIAANGKYYASIGDHHAVGGKGEHRGNAYVYEYDPAKKTLRQICDVTKLLNMPEGHYVPGKIHSRIDMGDDGWLYFATHRGSARATTDTYHYTGDWVIRCHPGTGKSEVVVRGPVPKHAIPTSAFDPKRLIFYGGTAAGVGKEIDFFAYDCKNGKLLYTCPEGPYRAMIFAKSTGKAYFTRGNQETSLMRFDPEVGKPVEIPGKIRIRAATEETPQGIVYTISSGQSKGGATLYAFNTKTEKVEELGEAAVGSQAYVASIDADPTGRYLYYVPGAHGGSERDGSAVIQYDTKTRKPKVIAFLHPFYQDKYGVTLKGTYSTAVNEKGDTLYITWNANRGSRAWDSCALTALHIPESERQ